MTVQPSLPNLFTSVLVYGIIGIAMLALTFYAINAVAPTVALLFTLIK